MSTALENGADIEKKTNNHGDTLLKVEPYSGHVDCAQLLIEKGAVVDGTRLIAGFRSYMRLIEAAMAARWLRDAFDQGRHQFGQSLQSTHTSVRCVHSMQRPNMPVNCV